MTKSAVRYLPVKSSMLESYSFDGKNFFAKFNGGGTYKYLNVSKSVVDGFEKASSKGTYFATKIRPTFSSEKLDD